MADIVLTTVDLDVFAGPAAVDVSLDVGATGQRGSRIWASPNGTSDLVGQDVKLYDMYLNTSTSEMFQYVQTLGAPTWVFLLSLDMNRFSAKVAVTFNASGQGFISYGPLPVGATVNDYVTFHNVRTDGTYIIASSNGLLVSGGILYVLIKARYYDSGANDWFNVTGVNDVDVDIIYKGVS